MAQLGIRDKDYRPNQYINPMLIGMGREPNMESAPYRIFDKTHPEHPDYEGGDDDEGDVQLELDLAHKREDHDHTPDFKLPDGRDYYMFPNHKERVPVDPSGVPIPPELINEEMMIALGGPELGGTGRKLTLSEYRDATDNAFSNLMNSDMTDKDFENYLDIKRTARRQMFGGI